MRETVTPIVLPIVIDPTLATAARRLVDEARRIVIFGHQHPDADALGSALGLAWALRAIGKECVVAVPDSPDAVYATFLPGLDAVVTTLQGAPFDLVIALDAGALSRYGDLTSRYQALLANAPILNIDHHLTSTGCGVVNIIDPRAAATAELLTLWLAQEQITIDENAAKCLLAGIITDTRSFEFDSTTPLTMLVGSYLMERGARPVEVVKPMYRMKSYSSAKLFGLAISSLQSAVAGHLVWAAITPAMWETAALPVGTGDEGIPSYLIDIEGAEIAICFRQTSLDEVRISVRTAGKYDATVITTRFGGGGHARAGGCSYQGTLAEAEAALLAAAREYLAD